MASSQQDYRKQEILEDARSWLDQLERTERLHREMEEDRSQEYREDIRADEMRTISLEYGLQVDGYVDVQVSEDRMTCLMNLYPPSLDGAFPDITAINEAMASCGVTAPIQGDVVLKALQELREKREALFDIILLRGRLPDDRIMQHLVIDKELLGKRIPEEHGGQIDHREFSPFHIIEKNQIVGRVVSEKPGSEGITVTGQKIPFETITPPTIQPGDNVEIRGDKLIAIKDGRLFLENNTVSIKEILEIRGDVGYETGHIDFPGDIVLNGTVKDGFAVKAGQDVMAAGTLDVTSLEAGGDITALKGLIGRKDGVVRAKGEIRAKFIEQCYVEAGGMVRFEIGIMNSVIHAGTAVLGGDKSIIVGGKLVCRDEVNVLQIGNKSETRTTIIAGVDYIIMNKLEWIRNQNIEMTEKINSIRYQVAASGDKDGKLAEMEALIRSSLLKLNQSSQDLISRLHQAEDAKIVVRGSVYPGTYIEICHVSYVVERPMSKVFFKLNKATGTIVTGQINR